MPNPMEIILGLFRNLRIEYKKWETNSLPLQAIKLFIEMIKGKQV